MPKGVYKRTKEFCEKMKIKAIKEYLSGKCMLNTPKELTKRREKWTGKGNPKYIDGKRNERLKKYLKILGRSHWRNLHEIILMRDNYTCQQCKGYGNVVHDIIPWKKTHTHNETNLITLCRSCHAKIERHGEKCKF